MAESGGSKSVRGRLVMTLVAAAVVLGVDQASKLWVVDGLGLGKGGAVNVIDPFLNFRMAWNTGVNFGIGGGDPGMTLVPLVILSFAVSAFAIWYAPRLGSSVQAIGCGVLAGGAIGNAVDRLHWGAVADFLNMSCCGFQNPWSFNIADIAIFAGLAMAVFLPLNRRPKPAADVPSDPAPES